ncbi:helix-turn-helix transcriptional regulator, partial [Cellulomonas triticagri]
TSGAPEVAPGVLHRVRDVMSGRLDPAPDVPVDPGPTRRYLDGVEGLRLMYLDRLTEAADTQRGLLGTATAEDDLVGVRVHATVLAEVLLYAGQQDEAWEVATRAVVLPTPAAGADGGLARAFHRRGLRVGAMLAATRGDRGLADALARGVTAAEADEGALDPVAPVAAVLELTEPDDEVAAVGRLWRAGEHLLSRGLVPSALHSWSYAARPYGPGRVRRLRAAFDAAPVPLLERHVRWQEALVHDPDADPAAFGVPAAALHVGHRPADRSTAADAGPSALTVREQEVAALAGRGMSNRAIAHELGLSVRTVENHVSRGLHKLGLHSRSDLIREPVLVPRTPTVAG